MSWSGDQLKKNFFFSGHEVAASGAVARIVRGPDVGRRIVGHPQKGIHSVPTFHIRKLVARKKANEARGRRINITGRLFIR